MEKALVTGGAGFIGSNVVHELVERGTEVTVLDDLYLGSRDNLEEVSDEIEFLEGSVLNRSLVEEAVEGCDRVFHLAARSSSPMHKEEPAKGARVNIEGFVNTVEAAIEEEVEKIIYASTSSMYGSADPPHREDMDLEPINRYTASKMSRELYARNYSYNSEIETTGLRYFSVYGPRERSKGKYANVVTQFLWKMMEGERPVIWGDGSRERDLVFVEDVARANIMASETGKADGEVINIGTGNPVTFAEMVDRLNETLGTEIEPEHIENPRESAVSQHRADISRARKLLDWESENSFGEGLEKTVRYYRNQA